MRRCALFLLIALALALLAVGAQAQERGDAAGDPPATPRISRLSWSGLTIRAEWNPVARATGYDLRWTPEERRRRHLTVSAERAVDGSPAEVSALWAGRWRVEVRARIGSGPSAVRGAWSRPRIVRVYDAPPRLEVERFDGEYALLNWTGVGASYELEWGERGKAKQFARRDGRSPTLELGPLKAGKTYEFRVRARDGAGRSGYSPTAVFTPTGWRGGRPGAGYVGRIGQIYALWFPQRGAEWYELSWINAADPTETARVRVGTATSGGSRPQVPGQIGRAGGFENGTWNVRVRAGPRGVWSPLYPLTLSNLPERPALSASTAPSGAVALSWIAGPTSTTRWDYRQQRSAGGWGAWTTISGSDASTANHTVSGLSEDVSYSFQLRAVNARGPGPASAAASAVAGLAPTAPSGREPLLYYDLDSTGGAMRSGSYAFLMDAADLTSGATTLAQVRAAAALLLNTGSDQGSDYTSVLAAVQVGDRITWFPFPHGSCWYTYRVTGISADPPPPARKLFRITLDVKEGCNFHTSSTDYLDDIRNLPATFRWGLPPSEPEIGPDGIRIVPPPKQHRPGGYAIEGGQTYRLRFGALPTPVVIDVPADMTLTSNFDGLYMHGVSGTYLKLDPLTGEDAEHVTPDGASPPSAAVVARFNALIASIRVAPLPGAGHLPGAPTLMAQTAASGAVALNWSAGPAGTTRWEYRQRREDGSWSTWSTIIGAGALTTSHTVRGLSEDMRYSFQVRAASAGGAGAPSAAASAVAGLTPTAASDRQPLYYDELDSTSAATRRGAYAFLTDADDLTSGATTFAEASAAAALLLNVSGYVSRYYGAVLATVQAGDRITWHPYSGCWYHYRVTEVLSVPTAPARKLFRIALESEAPCGVAAARSGNAKSYFDESRDNFATFGWDPPPNVPRVGADGIRIMPLDYPVEGGRTYRLSHRSPVVIDVPAGMTLTRSGYVWQSDGTAQASYVDAASGADFSLDPHSGAGVAYFVPTPNGETQPPAEVAARFETIIASIRLVPLS